MNKYKTVAAFLEDQPADKLAQMNKLREIIMAAEPSLEENLKWNAANYAFKGEDRITFNLMNKEGKVKLILHMGATKKEDKKAEPVITAPKGLVTWSSDIRGTISFEDLADVEAKKVALSKLIKDWLAVS